MKKDITTIEDIQLLVNTFYSRVRENETLGYVFDGVAQVNWEKHLPVMHSFWETVLFGIASFKGNPLAKHTALHERVPLTDEHFTTWLLLWHQTIDELFDGKVAQSAKSKAELMKILMLGKIQQLNTANAV
ncbi:group III truncated hemoglobin [Chitinophaga pinensis]|uniref:Group III truncated hemoglobin n=1 Tax=Chitinophaga pinensis TaxID=79329 RepID=A0A5C6LT88_9BACT|nr:group III truncated hemoglobin [Chitinophaga pinensis]TWV99806.1 group III truncated hemoglobin [Chitinophaga pinensis]